MSADLIKEREELLKRLKEIDRDLSKTENMQNLVGKYIKIYDTAYMKVTKVTVYDGYVELVGVRVEINDYEGRIDMILEYCDEDIDKENYDYLEIISREQFMEATVNKCSKFIEEFND